ncbi:MAG TPA: nucleotidyltransferase family protein [Gemmatimonadales bacterium]|jgi:molybdenum cofactor cytidylyltransferase|nr:nucleotidyltransferase family protein [Gemmatimonadales bacterium]
MPPHALLLAAGSGRRFGSQKLLALWRGRPLIGHAIALITALRDRGVIAGATAVVRRGDEGVAALARQSGLRVIPNAEPGQGLSHSLRLGLGALAALSPQPEAALIFLADQPSTPVEAVEEVVRAWELGGSAVVRPRYSGAPGEPGHPVLLDRDAWGLAERLTGGEGLGRALAQAPHLVLHVDVEGANPDVDTQTDLSRLEPPLP